MKYLSYGMIPGTPGTLHEKVHLKALVHCTGYFTALKGQS